MPVNCDNAKRDPVILVAFVAIALTIVMAFPLNIFPCRYTLDVLLFGEDREPSTVRHFLLTVTICAAVLITALFVPAINVVFSLMGGTSSAFVCFVLPAMFGIKLNSMGVIKDSKIRRVGMWLLAVGGIVIGATSTAVTIYNLVVPPPQLPPPPCK